MKFYCIEWKDNLQVTIQDVEYPCVVLRTNSWNDFGNNTTFDFEYYNEEGMQLYKQQSGIKILQRDIVTTKLPMQFTTLNTNDFCSLGQSLSYYEFLSKLPSSQYKDILTSLNDIVFTSELYDRFMQDHTDAMFNSLLRFSEAEKAYNEGASYFEELNYTEDQHRFNFTFSCQIGSADSEHKIGFDFSPDNTKLSRINAIIGKNGTGKTQVLALFARAMSGLSREGTFSPRRPNFSKVISISYSVFDEFRRPTDQIEDRLKEVREQIRVEQSPSDDLLEEEQQLVAQTSRLERGEIDLFSYVYCGVRRYDRLLTTDEIRLKLRDSLEMVEKKRRDEDWRDVLQTLLEDQSVNVESLLIGSTVAIVANNLYTNLSSGQRILALFMTEVIAHIEKDSIILFDEPELHLHPEAISSVARAFHLLLDKFDSYAIIATHSPIILQELPSSCVKIFRRKGNHPIVAPLDIESFGENLTVITQEVFETVGQLNNFMDYFRELLNSGYDFAQIMNIFDNKLSMNAQATLFAIIEEINQS